LIPINHHNAAGHLAQVAYHKSIKCQDFTLTGKLHKTAQSLRSGAAALLGYITTW